MIGEINVDVEEYRNDGSDYTVEILDKHIGQVISLTEKLEKKANVIQFMSRRTRKKDELRQIFEFSMGGLAAATQNLSVTKAMIVSQLRVAELKNVFYSETAITNNNLMEIHIKTPNNEIRFMFMEDEGYYTAEEMREVLGGES